MITLFRRIRQKLIDLANEIIQRIDQHISD
jgi:hypothetical protein